MTPRRRSRNSRKENMVEPAEPAGPDCLGNRASMPGHLGQECRAARPRIDIETIRPGQTRWLGHLCLQSGPTGHQRGRTGPAQPDSRFIQTAQPTVPARQTSRPVQLAELDRTYRRARQAAGPSSRAGNTASRTCRASHTCRASIPFRPCRAIQPHEPNSQPCRRRPTPP